jgi:muramoyltetrapeptide carboxypeptidase
MHYLQNQLLSLFTFSNLYIPGRLKISIRWRIEMKKLKSPALQPGGKTGVVAPASPVISLDQINQPVSRLVDLGYLVKLGASVVPMVGDLAGADTFRQTDLEQFWQDDSIQAIWCLRGGYGSIRLLPRLWFGLIAKSPKIFIGFSDITALELGFWSQVNLITFHGPVLTNMNSQFTITQALKILVGGWQFTQLEWPEGSFDKYIPIRNGKAHGIILGGNLTTLTSLMGTRFLPDFDGVILFLEEVDEQAYRIDRMLTQLIISGYIDTVAAILVGQCIPTVNQTETDISRVFTERLSTLRCPSAYGFPIGHIQEQWTIPQGVLVEVDTANGSFILLESPFI